MNEATLLADAQGRLVKIEAKLEKEALLVEEERLSLRRSQDSLLKQIADLTALLVEKERARLQGASGGPGSSGFQGAPAGAGAASGSGAPGPAAGGQLDVVVGMLQTLATHQQAFATNQQAFATNQQAVLDLLRNSAAGGKDVSVSSVDANKWQEIVNHSHLLERLSVIAPPAQTRAVFDSFGWDDRQESAQADRYMPHLQRVLPLPTRDAQWIRGDIMAGIFDVDPPAVPFSIRGKCDAAILTRAAKQSLLYHTGLLVMFELKKKVEPRHMYQAETELFAANVRCPDSRPFVVLTDLNSYWTILYLDGQTICPITADCAADAVFLIQCLLSESLARLSAGSAEGSDLVGMPGASLDAAGGSYLAAFKRRRLEVPAAGAVVGMSSSDVANLADLEGVLSDEEYRRLLLEQALVSIMRRPGMREHFGAGPGLTLARGEAVVSPPMPESSPPPGMYL